MFITLSACALASGLSLDNRRQSYLASIESNNDVFANKTLLYSPGTTSISDFVVSKSMLLQSNVTKYLQNEKVNHDVQLNTYKLLGSLPELFIDNLTMSSIYTSKFGTVLIDFETNNALFSIEVGSKSIGYFSEINSETVHFCEQAPVDTEHAFKESTGNLNSDFKTFFDVI